MGWWIFNNKFKKFANFVRDVSNQRMTNRNRVKNFGYVSRMDNLQAAILNFRLKKLNNIKKRRRNVKFIWYLNSKIYLLQKRKQKNLIPITLCSSCEQKRST